MQRNINNIDNERKQGEDYGDKTLDYNIDVIKYDLEFDIDPLFSKTSAKFDQSSSGLLLNNLILEKDAVLMLASHDFLN